MLFCYIFNNDIEMSHLGMTSKLKLTAFHVNLFAPPRPFIYDGASTSLWQISLKHEKIHLVVNIHVRAAKEMFHNFMLFPL